MVRDVTSVKFTSDGPDIISNTNIMKYQSITSHHIIYKLEQFTFEDVVASNIEGLKERGERRRNKQEDQHRICSFDPLHQASIPMRRIHVQNKHKLLMVWQFELRTHWLEVAFHKMADVGLHGGNCWPVALWMCVKDVFSELLLDSRCRMACVRFATPNQHFCTSPISNMTRSWRRFIFINWRCFIKLPSVSNNFIASLRVGVDELTEEN